MIWISEIHHFPIIPTPNIKSNPLDRISRLILQRPIFENNSHDPIAITVAIGSRLPGSRPQLIIDHIQYSLSNHPITMLY